VALSPRGKDGIHPLVLIDIKPSATVADSPAIPYSLDLDQVESWLGRQTGA
jgi:hypothetical protein